MEDKVVVISGGSRGIGKALVETYLKQGYKVATFARNQVQLDVLSEEQGQSVNLYTAAFDVSVEEECRKFVNEVVTRFDRIDCFYFNSGITRDKTFLKMDLVEWESVLMVNLVASFTLTQAIFHQMAQQTGSQNIYLMTSLAGVEGNFGQSNYSASKAGLIGLSKSLAMEGKKYDIRVNAISPAALTATTRPVITRLKAQALIDNQPFPKEWEIGTSEALAKTLLRFDETHTLTGKVLSINGSRIRIYAEPVLTDYEIN